MTDDIKKTTVQRMTKTIEALRHELGKLRTGRAHPSLLDHVTAPYYGNEVPLNQVANITVSDARTLVVTPWEKNMVSVIDKAIRASDLGLNPTTVGNVIRVPLPPLTEERRRDLVKVVRHEGEGTKVAVRNIRRDANQEFKTLLKDHKISEDAERRAQDEVQKITDKHITEIDKVLTTKEADLMEV
ncbi:ribosome-recycling factor [Gammaproteobacteria bacterium]